MRPPSNRIQEMLPLYKDDSFIAAYLRREGYDCYAYEVAKARARWKPKRVKHHSVGPSTESMDNSVNFEAMIRKGSEKLLAAILRYYEVRQ